MQGVGYLILLYILEATKMFAVFIPISIQYEIYLKT